MVCRKDSGLLKFKVMMLGDAGVGKTSIARRFTDENFMQTYIHTIGIDFLEKTIQCKPAGEDEDPVDVKLQMWDTAGQERYYQRRCIGNGAKGPNPFPIIAFVVAGVLY